MEEPDLTSVRARFERGIELYREMNTSVREWQDGCVVKSVKQTDAVYVIRAEFETWPLTRWAVLLGDAVANFRGALDHLIYALAAAEAGASIPPHAETLAFPNFKTLTAFNNGVDHKSVPKIGNLRHHSGLRTVIESHQRFAKDGRLIARLTDLDNTHKHRLIQIATASIADGKVEAEWRNRGGTMHLDKRPLSQAGPIATLVFDDPQDGEGVRAQFHFTLAFADAPNEQLMPTLLDLRMAVLSLADKMLEAVGVGQRSIAT